VRLLLDTHAALWAISEPHRLADSTRTTIEDGTNEVVVSVASVWEVAIKRKLGKIRLDRSLVVELEEAGVGTLPVVAGHAEAAGDLPLHHRDPFDRMLIAQATLEGLTIVTRDPAFAPYGVALMAA
jgi:PIN domain nuclease of toxin-antitoxin system